MKTCKNFYIEGNSDGVGKVVMNNCIVCVLDGFLPMPDQDLTITNSRFYSLTEADYLKVRKYINRLASKYYKEWV